MSLSLSLSRSLSLSLFFISHWDVVDAGLFRSLFRTSYLMVFGAAAFVHILSMPIQGVFSQTHNVKNVEHPKHSIRSSQGLPDKVQA